MSKAIIQTLTPVHIGSGKQYKHELEFFSEGNWIYIIDPEKIFQKIGANGIDVWVEAINRGDSIKDFLNKKIHNFKTEEISLKKCFLHNKIKKDKELHEQFYSPILGPCIPGSSIKGSIKTTILDYITDNSQLTKKNKIGIDVIKEKNQKPNKITYSDKITDEIFFGETANYKSTRFLKVGDAYFKNIETKVYFTEALNADKEGWKLNGNIANLYEAIPENSTAVFEFKFDENLFKINIEYEKDKWGGDQFKYLNKSTSELCNIINNSTKKALERELDFFVDIELDGAGNKLIEKYENILDLAEKCKQNEFIIRVGANSGYNFTTLRWIDKLEIFNPVNSNNEYALLRKEIQKNSFKKDYRNEALWPRTRKIITDGTPFGFVKITLISDEEYEIHKNQITHQQPKQGYGVFSNTTVKVQVKQSENATPKIPELYKGSLKKDIKKIPAQVVKSGKPNFVKLLIENNEIEMPLMGYTTELEVGLYIFVRIAQYRNGIIEQVNFDGYIRDS